LSVLTLRRYTRPGTVALSEQTITRQEIFLVAASAGHACRALSRHLPLSAHCAASAKADTGEFSAQITRSLNATAVRRGAGSTPALMEDVPDRRRRDPEAEPDELAVDAAVPQLGFSRARRITRSPMTADLRGRPPTGLVFGGQVQCRAISCRCHRSNVSGVTTLARITSRGSIPANAASTIRSFGSSRGRVTCLRNTASS